MSSRLLASIRRRLLDNSVMANAPPEAHPPLTHIPWTLEYVSNDGEISVPLDAQGERLQFPEASYLDIRRQQNRAWAEGRLLEGIAHAKNKDPQRAQECYRQGLEMAPDHANLLTAYGALLANQGENRPALELWERALRADPDHEQALLYRDTVRDRLLEGTKTAEPAVESDKKPAMVIQASKEDPGTGGYDLVVDEEEDNHHPSLDTSSDSGSSTSGRPKRKKKRKRKRHRKHQSDASFTDDSEAKQRRRRKREHKKRRKRKEKKRRKRELDSSDEERNAGTGSPDNRKKEKGDTATKESPTKAVEETSSNMQEKPVKEDLIG